VQVSFNLGKKRVVKRLGKESLRVASLENKMNNNFSANYALVLQFVTYL